MGKPHKYPEGAIKSRDEFLSLLEAAHSGKTILLYSVSSYKKMFHWRCLTKEAYIRDGKIRYHNRDGQARNVKLSHRGLGSKRDNVRGYFFTNFFLAVAYAHKVNARIDNKAA